MVYLAGSANFLGRWVIIPTSVLRVLHNSRCQNCAEIGIPNERGHPPGIGIPK